MRFIKVVKLLLGVQFLIQIHITFICHQLKYSIYQWQCFRVGLQTDTKTQSACEMEILHYEKML